MRPPVRAPPAPRPRARAAGSFFVVFVRFFKRSASSRLRFPVLKHALFLRVYRERVSAARAALRRRDGPPPPSARSRAHARSRHRASCRSVPAQVQARLVLLVVHDRLPQARGGRGTQVFARRRARRQALGRVRPVRPLVAPVLRARQRPRVPGEGTRGGVRRGEPLSRRNRGGRPSNDHAARATAPRVARDRATPSTSSTPTATRLGVVAAFARRRRDARLRGRRAPGRPYLREREKGRARRGNARGNARKRTRKRGNARGDVADETRRRRRLSRARAARERARAEPRSAPTLKEKKPLEEKKPKPRSAKTPLSAETPSEESRRGMCEDSMIAASILGSAFGSAENAVSCGVPKAARTFRGRPRAARAGAAAAAIEAAGPMAAAAARALPTRRRRAWRASPRAAADSEGGCRRCTRRSGGRGLPTASPAAPRSPPRRAVTRPARRSARPPLRGGGISRGAGCASTEAPPHTRREEEGPRPPPLRRRAIERRHAARASRVRRRRRPPGRSMLVRLLADSLGCGHARLLRLREPSARAEGARASASGGSGGPHRARDPSAHTGALELVTLAAARWLRNFADGTAQTRARAPPSAPRRVGGVFVSTLSKEDKRREAAETFPFPPPRSGLEPASCRDKEGVLLDDADADPWGLGCNQEWSDAIDWGIWWQASRVARFFA